MKPLYFSLGWIFFCLGALGVALPVLPTTPFMLLALWSFSKSSDRFHNWLYHHALFGPLLQQWEQYRVIPLMAKIFAIIVMILSVAYITVCLEVSLWIKISVTLICFYGAFFILTKPSKCPITEDENQKN